MVEKDLLLVLLSEINAQLEACGLKVKNSKGAIVDATLIESAGRPRKVYRSESDNDDPEKVNVKSEVEYSKDGDARWKKKGKKFHFGYQSCMKVDAENGFVETVVTSPANNAEVAEFEKSTKLSEKSRGRRIYYDKGVACKKNRKLLKTKGLKDGIMHKANRNNPLTKWQKKFNQLVSQKRWRVEQSLGTLKRHFKFTRASYFGTEKVNAQAILKAICHYLLKAANMLGIHTQNN